MIVIDDREQTQHDNIPELLEDIPVSVERLQAGDFAFLGSEHRLIGVERSEIGNLVQKLQSGELEDQLYKCQEYYSQVILIVEGFFDGVGGLLATYRQGSRGYFRTRVFPNTTYEYVMATLVRLSEMGVEVLCSPGFYYTISLVKTIYKQRTKPEEEHTLFKRTRALKLPVKLTANPSVPRLMALANRMPEKVAIRLVNTYGSIWAVLNAPDEELLQVDGFGRGLLAKLKESLGKDD